MVQSAIERKAVLLRRAALLLGHSAGVEVYCPSCKTWNGHCAVVPAGCKELPGNRKRRGRRATP